MSSLEEIEAAIIRLRREEVFALNTWLQQRIDEAWDQQFEADATSGRLAQAARKAIEEHRAGNSMDFPGDEK
jgi:hypothetical protein